MCVKLGHSVISLPPVIILITTEKQEVGTVRQRAAVLLEAALILPRC